jgi:5-methylcytosine-specific restriction endonuclease McrA
MAYSDDIKSGKWQRLRLKVMNRDQFKCLACKTENNLNVHHLYYESGRKIWDYDIESLVTLCDDCHNKLHKDLAKVAGMVAFRVLVGKLDLTDID